jgi:hypothetical protein
MAALRGWPARLGATMKRASNHPRQRLEQGEPIPRSLSKSWQVFAVAAGMIFLALCLCGLGCFSIGVVVLGKEPSTIQMVVLVGLGVVLIPLGIAWMAYVGYATWRQSFYLRNKERFVLGETSLQWVIRQDELVAHLPYDNMRDVRLKKLKAPNGSPYPIIGIDLIDPKRDDTFIRDLYRESDWEEHGFDFAIWDLYEQPLKTFHKRLTKAWEAARGAAPESE